MVFRMALLILLLILAGGQARADGLRDVYRAYAGCMDGVAGNVAFAPLAASGLFAGGAAGDGQGFVTPAQAGLIAQAQAAEAVCQVDLRTRLENLDTKLADLAAQERQLSDANQLMLFNRAEDWGDYVRNRGRIEGDFWRAAAGIPAVETALGEDDPVVGVDTDMAVN